MTSKTNNAKDRISRWFPLYCGRDCGRDPFFLSLVILGHSSVFPETHLRRADIRRLGTAHRLGRLARCTAEVFISPPPVSIPHGGCICRLWTRAQTDSMLTGYRRMCQCHTGLSLGRAALWRIRGIICGIIICELWTATILRRHATGHIGRRIPQPDRIDANLGQ